MAKNIYWLQEIYLTDRAVVGGKGANLGDLARGLNVPPGFCLSAEAYYRNLEHFGVNEKIAAAMSSVDGQDLKSVQSASEQISAMILAVPFLPEVEDAIREAYACLAQDKVELKVGVRSSATAEDLVEASFAGLQETFLNVEGIDDVLMAVKKCWASLWTARAIYYRAQKGFDHEKVTMAVVIQEMVPASVSGVMFTANPVNNLRDEIVIEAVRGLGEQLVSGHKAGDVYKFRKEDVRVDFLEMKVSDPQQGPMLNDYDVRELAHIGLKVELFYGDYQDIEWAYHQGKFYFLQTRPITTLGDEMLPDLDLSAMSEMQRELMDWVAERFPDPILPVDGIVVKVLFMAQLEAMQSSGYVVDEMDWSRVEKGIFPEFFQPPGIRPGLKRFWPYLRLGRTLRTDPAAEWASEQVYLLDTLKKLKGRDISQLPLEVINDYLTEGLKHLHYFIVLRYNYFVQNRIPSATMLKLLKFIFGREGVGIYEDLLAGSENVTLEINKALNSLAAEARSSDRVSAVFLSTPPEEIKEKLENTPEGASFVEKFNNFLQLYGERETTMGLGGIASPTWQDSPEVVYGMIRGIVTEDPRAEAAREALRKHRAQEAENIVYARLSKGILGFLPVKPLFRSLLRHARSFAAFRENSHYDITRSMHVFRILYTELGKRLVRRGLLQQPGDIVYLSYFEIKDIINEIFYGIRDIDTRALAAKIESRKVEQERRFDRWKNRQVKVNGEGAMEGTPASHGTFTGPARIIMDPREFHKVRKGEVLVAPYTNPAWTPLFTVVGALVVETGGLASHAAIIAREYGIPAVMGVSKATQILQEGEIITVNGTTGAIHRGGGGRG